MPLLNEIECVLQAKSEIIQELSARVQQLQEAVNKNPLDDLNLPVLLRWMLDTAVKNASRKNPQDPRGNSFDIDMKYFCSYLYITAGPMLYDLLHRNLLQAIPSLKEVERVLLNISKPIVEGSFRFTELKEFLVQNDFPLKVWISEDGTRIVQKFLYDASSNSIIGPVLPLANNGVPIINSFPALSAPVISHHFEKGIPASSAYAIMAQPIKNGAPSFCLALFGTDNKFTSEYVYRRWNYISEELGKLDVEVIGFASDGDPKLLTAMHSQMFKQSDPPERKWVEWFFASKDQKYIVTQDAIHTVNKFRHRLCPANLLPIGNFTISQGHLRLVLEKPRDLHGLSVSDLDKQDKMNFNSSVKICSTRVTDILDTIPGAAGTKMYLTVMRYVMEAFLDENLSPSDRIYKMWYALHFLRVWKAWLLSTTRYSLDNFVTRNLYMCVEILAHALILLVVKFRGEHTPEFFLVFLFASQACESFFRYARSMTSTLSTVINFSMKELLQKVRRIDILQNVVSKLSGKLVFPREKRKRLLGVLTAEKLSSLYLPTNDEIESVVLLAKSDVLEAFKHLGITPKFPMTVIKNAVLSCKNFDLEDNSDIASQSYECTLDEDDIPLDFISAFPTPHVVSGLSVSTLASSASLPDLLPTSPYLYVAKSNGEFIKLKKSTFCWVLSSEGLSLSSDRVLRVREKIITSFGNRRTSQHSNPPRRKAEVEVGEWAIFRIRNKLVIGNILGFAYLSGNKTTYTLLTAPTKAPEGIIARGLGCLCDWYSITPDNILKSRKSPVHTYVNLDYYVTSIPPPDPCDQGLKILPEVLPLLEL